MEIAKKIENFFGKNPHRSLSGGIWCYRGKFYVRLSPRNLVLTVGANDYLHNIFTSASCTQDTFDRTLRFIEDLTQDQGMTYEGITSYRIRKIKKEIRGILGEDFKIECCQDTLHLQDSLSIFSQPLADPGVLRSFLDYLQELKSNGSL